MLQIKTFLCRMCAENAYLITDVATGCTAVVDPGTYNDELAEALAQIPAEKRVAILLTHAHFDHIGAAARLQEVFALPVICHKAEEQAVGDPHGNASAFFGLSLSVPRVTQTVQDGSRIVLGETEIQVLHTPGHTAGGVCYMTDEVIFSGDTLFCCGEGRTDLPGGDFHALCASLKKLGDIKGDRIVYPGHGEMTTLSAERINNPWVGGSF